VFAYLRSDVGLLCSFTETADPVGVDIVASWKSLGVSENNTSGFWWQYIGVTILVLQIHIRRKKNQQAERS
jgi:hypothetical protein